jgi:hypothetical protein
MIRVTTKLITYKRKILQDERKQGKLEYLFQQIKTTTDYMDVGTNTDKKIVKLPNKEPGHIAGTQIMWREMTTLLLRALDGLQYERFEFERNRIKISELYKMLT